MINVVLPKRAGSCPAPASLPIPCSAHRRVSNGRVNRPSVSGTAARRHWASACPARRPIRSLGPIVAAATPTKKDMGSQRSPSPPNGNRAVASARNGARIAAGLLRLLARRVAGRDRREVGSRLHRQKGFDSCGWRFQYGGRRPLPRARARPRTKPATSSAMPGAGPASPRSAALPLGVTWVARLSR